MYLTNKIDFINSRIHEFLALIIEILNSLSLSTDEQTVNKVANIASQFAQKFSAEPSLWKIAVNCYYKLHQHEKAIELALKSLNFTNDNSIIEDLAARIEDIEPLFEQIMGIERKFIKSRSSNFHKIYLIAYNLRNA